MRNARIFRLPSKGDGTQRTREDHMGFYLVQVAYKDTAAKTLIGHPQAREDAIGKACASVGGKLHSFFFSFGEYDVAMIAEFPDNATAAGFGLDAVAGARCPSIIRRCC
jgi:uncharacterized protein with GYD domain